MKFGLGKKSICLWRIQGTLTALLFCFLSGAVAALLPIAGIITCIIVITIYLLYFFWYVPRLYQTAYVFLEDGRLTWKIGLLFPVKTSLRLETILTATISHTPLQIALGLCTLSVRPVGAPISLRQLSEQDARQLMQLVEEAADD